MKGHLLLLIAAILFSTATVFAQGGTTGPLTWNFNNGTLTISGNGEMPDYPQGVGVPWAEYRTSIHTVIMGTGITRIGFSAFWACVNLTSATIPNTVTSIGGYAFSYCYSLELLINHNLVPVDIDASVFYIAYPEKCTLKVPLSSVNAYQNATEWKKFNIEGDGIGVEEIEAFTTEIYPNPTTGELKIESGLLKIENIVIYDVFGKIQKIGNWKTGNAIDISHLSNGIYFVKIYTESGEVTRKVVKE